jgi:hypothetical protein
MPVIRARLRRTLLLNWERPIVRKFVVVRAESHHVLWPEVRLDAVWNDVVVLHQRVSAEAASEGRFLPPETLHGIRDRWPLSHGAKRTRSRGGLRTRRGR